MSNIVLVSVIITNYNYGRFLGRAIRSCLHQSLAPELFEIIVIDDCSTDHSRAVIENFRSHIRPFLNDRQRGVAYCSNLGVRHSKGMYVIRVDADDYINQKMLEIMLMFLDQNPTLTFAYCDHILVNEKEGVEERVYMNTEEALLNHGAGIMFKKSCLEAIGLYDEEMMNCEDMVLLKKLDLEGYKGVYVPLPMYRYLRHGLNMTEDQESRKDWESVAQDKIKNSKKQHKV